MTRRPTGTAPREGAPRMAPGGRLWSESPVRRPLPRVRSMGVAGAIPPGCIQIPPPYLDSGGVSEAFARLTDSPGDWTFVTTGPFTVTVTLQDTTATAVWIRSIPFGGFDPTTLPGTGLGAGQWAATFPASPGGGFFGGGFSAQSDPVLTYYYSLADVLVCPA